MKIKTALSYAPAAIIMALVAVVIVKAAGSPAHVYRPPREDAGAPIGLLIVGWSALAVFVTIVSTGVYHLALSLWYKTCETRRAIDDLTLAGQFERVELERARITAERQRIETDRERLKITEQVWPDGAGQYPLLWDGQKALDANRGVVFTIPNGAQVITPELAIPEQKARLLRAAGGWPPASSDGGSHRAKTFLSSSMVPAGSTGSSG